MKFLDRLLRCCYAAALLTLPWAGVGVLRLATGRDWGGGLQPSWVFMGLAMAVAAARWAARRGGRPAAFRPGPVPTAGLVVMAAVLVSALGLVLAPAPVPWQDAAARFLKQAVQLLIMLGFTLWAAWWTRGEERWIWTARLIVTGALLQACYGGLQLAAHDGGLGWFAGLDRIFTSNPSILSGSGDLYIDNAMQDVARLRGTVCEPLYLGNYLLLAIPMVWVTRWPRWQEALATGVLLVLLMLTWSRGAWLAAAGAAVVAGVLWARCGLGGRWLVSGRLLVQGLGLVLLLGLVLFLLGDPGLVWRRLLQSFSSRDWSNLTRLYSMQAGWRAFLLSPVVGIGWGQFGWHFPALVDPLGLQSQFTWPVVNNFYLEVLSETGVLGLSALVMLLVRIGRELKASVASERGRDSWRVRLVVAVVAAFVGVWLQLLTFSQYNLPHIWLALGLLIAATRVGGAHRLSGAEGFRP